MSDAEGVFVMRGMKPGQYVLRARKQGYAMGQAQITIGSDGTEMDVIEIELGSLVPVLVTCVDEHGGRVTWLGRHFERLSKKLPHSCPPLRLDS